MQRAKRLASEANDFGLIKKKAEANVVRWEWATSHRTEPEPGYFETRRQARGKPLKTEPTDWKEDRAHEGFDAEGRIVALHVQRNTPNWQYETFYRYEPGGIARFYYDYGSNDWLGCVYMTVENGRITQTDHIYPRGYRTEVYRFDDKGHYAGYDTEGLSPNGKTFKGGYDFDTAPDGTIVRVWWLWPDKPREVFWEHASVRAAAKAARAATATKPAAKQPAAKKPTAKKPAAKKPTAKKSAAKKSAAKKQTAK